MVIRHKSWSVGHRVATQWAQGRHWLLAVPARGDEWCRCVTTTTTVGVEGEE